MNKALTQDRAILLKRLRFQSWHRGCKETDLLMGCFADEHMEGLSDEDLAIYEALLDEDDADIWNWLVGRSEPTKAEYAPLLEKMKLDSEN